MKWILYAVIAAVAIISWRRRHDLEGTWCRLDVAANVRWLASLILVRRTRPADVQFAIIRQIVALRTVGVTGTVHVPGQVEVHLGDLDWQVLAGALQWTAAEVAAGLCRRCEHRDWMVSTPIDVVLVHSSDSRRLLPTAAIVAPSTTRSSIDTATGARAGWCTERLPRTEPMATDQHAAGNDGLERQRGTSDGLRSADRRLHTQTVERLPRTEPAAGLLLLPADPALTAFSAHSGVESLTVGRSADADVRVDAPTVSRMHCLLFRSTGRWFIDDLCSANGTFLNGNPVLEPQPLADGDRVGLGSHVTFSVQ